MPLRFGSSGDIPQRLGRVLYGTESPHRVVYNGVTVWEVPPPSISSFTANPDPVNNGSQTTLSWTANHAYAGISINGSPVSGATDNTASTGSTTVAPSTATTYTLTAVCDIPPPATASLTVSVNYYLTVTGGTGSGWYLPGMAVSLS